MLGAASLPRLDRRPLLVPRRALADPDVRPRHFVGHGGEVETEPSGQQPRVFRPQGTVTDRGDRGSGGAQGSDAAFAVSSRSRPRRADRELEQRHSARDEFAHSLRAVGLAQLARVEPSGFDRDERLRHEALVVLERLERGLASGCIAVEAEHDLAAKLVLVHEQGDAAP